MVVDRLKALDPNRPIREADSCTAANIYSISGNSSHIHGTHVPVEGPSTASITDIEGAFC
jgi:hypothetical protein